MSYEIMQYNVNLITNYFGPDYKAAWGKDRTILSYENFAYITVDFSVITVETKNYELIAYILDNALIGVVIIPSCMPIPSRYYAERVEDEAHVLIRGRRYDSSIKSFLALELVDYLPPNFTVFCAGNDPYIFWLAQYHIYYDDNILIFLDLPEELERSISAIMSRFNDKLQIYGRIPNGTAYWLYNSNIVGTTYYFTYWIIDSTPIRLNVDLKLPAFYYK